MARARALLRVELPDGKGRIWWREHHLSGSGTTPEAARAALDALLEQMAADGLEPVGALKPAILSESRAHAWPPSPNAPVTYHYGHGETMLRLRSSK